MADFDEDIDIKVELHNELSAPAKAAEKSLDDLGDEAKEVAGQLALFEVAADKAGDEAAELGAKAKVGAKGVDDLGDSAGKTSKKVGNLGKQSEKSSGGVLKFFRAIKLLTVVKWAVILDGVTALITAVNSLAAAVISVIGPLAKMSSLIVAWPGMFLAGAQAVSTFKLGLKGMGEALELMADPEAKMKEINKALEQMHPNAREVVSVLYSFRREWTQLQKSVQGRLWAGIADLLADLGQTYIPVLRAGLEETADSLNTVMKYTAGWLDNREMVASIGWIMKNNAGIVEDLGIAFSNFGRVFVRIMRAAGPMLAVMSDDFRNFSQYVVDLTTGRRGDMRDYFLEAYKLWKDWLDVLKDFGVGFWNIVRASKPMSKALGEDFANIAQNFRDWTESDKGQRKMRKFFTSMIPVVREIGRWLRDIGAMWFRSAMEPKQFLDISKRARTELLPTIERIVNAMGGKFLDALVAVAEAIADMAEAGLLDSLTVMLHALADAAKIVAGVFERLPDPLQEIITVLAGAFFLRKMVMKGGGAAAAAGTAGLLGLGGRRAAAGGAAGAGAARGGGFLGFGGRGARGAPAAGGRFAFRGGPGLVGTAAMMLGGGSLIGGEGGWGGAGKGAMAGAGIGMMFGPMGAAIGAGIGAGIGAVGGVKGIWNAVSPEMPGTTPGGGPKPGMPKIKGRPGVVPGLTSPGIGGATSGDPQNRKDIGQRLADVTANIHDVGRKMGIETTSGFQKFDKNLSKMQAPSIFYNLHRIALNTGETMMEVARRYFPQTTKALKDMGIEAEKDFPRFKNLDNQWLKMMKKNPHKTFELLQKHAGRMGLTAGELADMYFPKTAKALEGIDFNAGKTSERFKGLKMNIEDLPSYKALRIETPGLTEAEREAEALREHIAFMRDWRLQVSIGRGALAPGVTGPGVQRKAGGTAIPGVPTLVGEGGPEAFVSRSGKMSILGANGPELGMFREPGAVVTHGATVNPWGGNPLSSPQWAVEALQNAYSAQVGVMAPAGASRAAEGRTASQEHWHLHLDGNFQASTPEVAEENLRRAWRKMERERRERS